MKQYGKYIIRVFILSLIPLCFLCYASSEYTEWVIFSGFWIYINRAPFLILNPLYPLGLFASLPSILFIKALHDEKLENELDIAALKAIFYTLIAHAPIMLLATHRSLREWNSLYFDSITRMLSFTVIIFVILPYFKRKILCSLVEEKHLIEEEAIMLIKKDKTIFKRYLALLILSVLIFVTPFVYGYLQTISFNEIALFTMGIGLYIFSGAESSNLQVLKVDIGILPYYFLFLNLIFSALLLAYLYHIIRSVNDGSFSKIKTLILWILSIQGIYLVNISRIVIHIWRGTVVVIPIPIVLVIGLILLFIFRKKAQLVVASRPDSNHELRRIIARYCEIDGNVEGELTVPFFYRLLWRIRKISTISKRDDKVAED